MEDVKNWYQSRTIWGALIAIAASLAHTGGINLNTGDQMMLVDSLISLSGALGGIFAIYGRLRATVKLQ